MESVARVKPTISELERILAGEPRVPIEILPSGEIVRKDHPDMPAFVRDPRDEDQWRKILRWEHLADSFHEAAKDALNVDVEASEAFHQALLCARRIAHDLRETLVFSDAE